VSFLKTTLDQGVATVLAAVIAVCGISYQLHANRQADLLKDKKDAYLAAFDSINDVLGNTAITPDGGTKACPPSNPHEFDLTKLRVAMDRLILFSGSPIESVAAYQKAIGISGASSGWKPMVALTEFRQVAMRDLGIDVVAESSFLSMNTWIATAAHPSTKTTTDCVLSQRKSL